MSGERRGLIARLKRERAHRDGFASRAPGLEELEAEEREAERTEQYLAGLLYERTSVMAERARVKRMDPNEKVVLAWMEPHEWPRADAYESHLMARLEAIDREIARVEEEPRTAGGPRQ